MRMLVVEELFQAGMIVSEAGWIEFVTSFDLRP